MAMKDKRDDEDENPRDVARLTYHSYVFFFFSFHFCIINTFI